jgi:class 3 adenylate cyclase
MKNPMAEVLVRVPLTGHVEFDALIEAFAIESDQDKSEIIRQRIWDEFGSKGAVFISDMANFSSTSRKIGVCHFLKLIHRTRQIVGPAIESNNGTLLKFDADNCYAYFDNTDDAISASIDIDLAILALNEESGPAEQIFFSVGIDYGRLLLVGDTDFFGDPVNTSSKLGEDLAVRAEVLITERAIKHSQFKIPEGAEILVAHISEIDIQYVRIPMLELRSNSL